MDLIFDIINVPSLHSDAYRLTIETDADATADALNRLDETDLVEIVGACRNLADAGLELSLARLKQGDDMPSIDQRIAIIARLKASLVEELRDPRVWDAGTRQHRPMTADERARIEGAVGV